MEMRHRLSCRSAVVDSDIESIRCVPLVENSTRFVGEAQNFFTLHGRRVEQRRDVSARDDQRVARAYGVAVPEHHGVRALDEDLLPRGIAERTGFFGRRHGLP